MLMNARSRLRKESSDRCEGIAAPTGFCAIDSQGVYSSIVAIVSSVATIKCARLKRTLSVAQHALHGLHGCILP